MPDLASPQLEVDVPSDAAGERFDRVVARLANISRQRAMALLEEGKVRSNHRRVKKGERAEAGAHLTIILPASEAPVPQPELPLVVLYEDPWLLALDKPPGVQMHPLEAGELGTLANAVVARYPDIAGASTEERCPGLLHRLDRETSGVVLWARKREAFDAIRAQFTAKSVEKRYFALVDGFVEGAGELNLPLAHDPNNDKRMIATPYPADAEKLKARPAITRYRPLGQGDAATLLEVEIPTGVMHQIRAHFGFVGYPVRGDTFYGGHALEGLAPGSRHLLHAASIAFDHPDGSGRKRVDSKLPPDFLAGLAGAGIHPPA